MPDTPLRAEVFRRDIHSEEDGQEIENLHEAKLHNDGAKSNRKMRLLQFLTFSRASRRGSIFTRAPRYYLAFPLVLMSFRV